MSKIRKFVSQNNGKHWWIVGMSSNFNNPLLYIDAWLEEFAVGQPCRSCDNGSSIGERSNYRKKY